MKILLTGGAGFIGSAVARLAISRSHNVLNLDALTYAGSLDNVASVQNSPAYNFERADIRDCEALERIFFEYCPEVVMHLAAESHVDRSISGPSDFIQTNINGTFNLLEVTRKYWIEKGKPNNFRFLHVSTDEVFGSLPLDEDKFFTEETPYDPRSPYSASKASSDFLVRAWHSTYSLPVLITNCSNNYGPYHYPEKLIPLIITHAIEGQYLPLYGDGSNVRDWLHVDDHADALLLVASNGEVGKQYVIGGNNACTNLELVKNICLILDRLRPRISGSYQEMIKFVEDRAGHDLRYAIDANRIQEELGWTPSVGLAQGLEKTIRWYLDNEEWWRPRLKARK